MSEPVNAAEYRGESTRNYIPKEENRAEESTSRTVGIWRMVRRIHCGTWCDLFLAQPADSVGNPRCDYVVKILRRTWQEDPEGARQVRTEASAAASARHPHLGAVLDANLEGARPYVVMPRLEARTLAEAKESAEVPVPVALWWMRQCAQGLQALHQAGWVHGDVKPENLLVDSRGHLTLVDFGMGQQIGGVWGNAFRGTLRYGAPERHEKGTTVQASSDIFAVGLMLEELTKGVGLGFDGIHRIIAQAKASNPRNRPSADALVAMLLRMEIETLHLHIQPSESGVRRAA